MTISPALLRILARYLAGIIAGSGIMQVDIANDLAADPDVIAFLGIALQYVLATLPGLVIGAVTEWFYWLALRLGWRT